MLAMMPRLLAHRPAVAISLSSVASSCARVQKYVASWMPPRSTAMPLQTVSARTSSVRSLSARARSCATMAQSGPRRRPPDHLAQRALASRQVALGHEQQRHRAQILRLYHGIDQPAADFRHPVQLAPSELQLARDHADLRASPERLRPQRAIPGRLGCRDSLVGLGQRAVEGPLLAIRDRQVVAALGDALSQTGPVERRERNLPGPDRLGVPPPQLADAPQILGAARPRGHA